jgi:hypothetical protein
MPLRTTRAFSIGGRRYKAGEPIELAGKHLRLFQAIGYVEYGPEEYQAEAIQPEPEIVEAPAPQPRRNYRRRDMKAGE